jgi:hypothetical protein
METSAMTNDLIELPEIGEINELIEIAKNDITAVLKEDKELAPQGDLILEVLKAIEEKIDNKKDLNALPIKEKISLAAHLSFFHNLLEDFFFSDEDFDDFDYDEEEEAGEDHR